MDSHTTETQMKLQYTVYLKQKILESPLKSHLLQSRTTQATAYSKIYLKKKIVHEQN